MSGSNFTVTSTPAKLFNANNSRKLYSFCNTAHEQAYYDHFNDIVQQAINSHLTKELGEALGGHSSGNIKLDVSSPSANKLGRFQIKVISGSTEKELVGASDADQAKIQGVAKHILAATGEEFRCHPGHASPADRTHSDLKAPHSESFCAGAAASLPPHAMSALPGLFEFLNKQNERFAQAHREAMAELKEAYQKIADQAFEIGFLKGKPIENLQSEVPSWVPDEEERKYSSSMQPSQDGSITLEQHQSALATVRTERDRLEALLRQKEKELANADADRNKLNTEIAQLKALIQPIETRANETEEAFAKLHNEHADLRQICAEKETTILGLEAELGTLRTAVETHTAATAALQAAQKSVPLSFATVERNESETVHLHRRPGNSARFIQTGFVDDGNTPPAEEISNAEIAELKETIATLQATLAEAQKATPTVLLPVTVDKEELAGLSNAQREPDERKYPTSERPSSAPPEFAADLARPFSSIDANLDTAQQGIAAQKGEMDALKAKLQEAQETLAKKEKEIARLKGKVASDADQKALLEKRLETLGKDLAKAKQAAKTEFLKTALEKSRLEKQAAAGDARIDALRKAAEESANKDRQISDLKDRVSDLTAKVAIAQKMTANADTQTDTEPSEADAFEKQLKEIENKRNSNNIAGAEEDINTLLAKYKDLLEQLNKGKTVLDRAAPQFKLDHNIKLLRRVGIHLATQKGKKETLAQQLAAAQAAQENAQAEIVKLRAALEEATKPKKATTVETQTIPEAQTTSIEAGTQSDPEEDIEVEVEIIDGNPVQELAQKLAEAEKAAAAHAAEIIALQQAKATQDEEFQILLGRIGAYETEVARLRPLAGIESSEQAVKAVKQQHSLVIRVLKEAQKALEDHPGKKELLSQIKALHNELGARQHQLELMATSGTLARYLNNEVAQEAREELAAARQKLETAEAKLQEYAAQEKKEQRIDAKLAMIAEQKAEVQRKFTALARENAKLEEHRKYLEETSKKEAAQVAAERNKFEITNRKNTAELKNLHEEIKNKDTRIAELEATFAKIGSAEPKLSAVELQRQMYDLQKQLKEVKENRNELASRYADTMKLLQAEQEDKVRLTQVLRVPPLGELASAASTSSASVASSSETSASVASSAASKTKEENDQQFEELLKKFQQDPIGKSWQLQGTSAKLHAFILENAPENAPEMLARFISCLRLRITWFLDNLLPDVVDQLAASPAMTYLEYLGKDNPRINQLLKKFLHARERNIKYVGGKSS